MGYTVEYTLEDGTVRSASATDKDVGGDDLQEFARKRLLTNRTLKNNPNRATKITVRNDDDPDETVTVNV